MTRTAERQRQTKETSIDLFVNVDGSGKVDVSTGLPFFDHMLSQLGKHSRFDLRVACQGDIDIDSHHTVEDVGMSRRRGRTWRQTGCSSFRVDSVP